MPSPTRPSASGGLVPRWRLSTPTWACQAAPPITVRGSRTWSAGCAGGGRCIFGLEVSRLARSSADLSRLLELARLTDTLVVDSDGTYDLASFNDRLLLGLKGTMTEAELHFLAGRLQGAKRAAAERGELRFPLPVGFVYDDEGATVIDPDAEVQAAVGDLFAAFRSGGSAYQVVAASGPALPATGLWRGVGRPAALGPAHPCPGAGGAGQPRLRRHLRVRPLPLPPRRRARRHGAHQGRRASPGGLARSSSTTTTPVTSVGTTTWPTRPAWLRT